MKYCPFCGVGLQDDMAFCPSCGKRFLNASAGVEEQNALKEAIEETTEKETAAQVVPVQVCPPVTQQPEQPRQKTKKRKWVLLIVCIALVTALLVAGLSFFSDKVEKYCGSVLYLELYDDHDSVIGTASGFLIRDGRTLVTNYHVIDGTYHIVAQTANGSRSTTADTVLAYDEKLDLAVLQCEDDLGILPIPVGDSGSVKQGDHVYAIGYPLGVANTLSEGVISSLYEDEGVLTIQTTAAISSGSSGGVLMNKRGEAIGVTAASYVDGQNLNLAIPIAYVEELMEEAGVADYISLDALYTPTYRVDYVLENTDSIDQLYAYVNGYISSIDYGCMNDGNILNGSMYLVSTMDAVLGYTFQYGAEWDYSGNNRQGQDPTRSISKQCLRLNNINRDDLQAFAPGDYVSVLCYLSKNPTFNVTNAQYLDISIAY